MRIRSIVVCAQFCQERDIVAVEGLMARAPKYKHGSDEWAEFATKVYKLLSREEWWFSKLATITDTLSGRGTRFPISEETFDAFMDLYAWSASRVKAPQGRRLTWSMFGRAALDALTEGSVQMTQTSGSSEPANLNTTQDEVTLRELRNEIRELHAMLRAALQDIEMVRRDVGDVRSLVRAVIGPKAPGRPQ